MLVTRGRPRMNEQYLPDHELEDRLSRRLLDVFIGAGWWWRSRCCAT